MLETMAPVRRWARPLACSGWPIAMMAIELTPACATGNAETTGAATHSEEVGATRDAGERDMCQGGSGLEIQMYMRSRNGEASLAGQNELAGLYVLGDCTFFVRPIKQLYEFRTGKLTAAQAQNLAVETRYSEWPSWYGWLGPTDVVDGVVVLFADAHGTFGCAQGCGGATLEPATSEAQWQPLIDDWYPMFAAWYRWHVDLYAQSLPVAGAVRVAAYPYGLDDLSKIHPEGIYDWPESIELSSVTFESLLEVPFGGVLIPADSAQPLHALRDEARRRTYEQNTGVSPNIFVLDGERVLVVEIDDALPFEDEEGTIQREDISLCAPGAPLCD